MTSIYDNRAVGVFDSGLGGLTAVRALEKICPNENIIYFGDTGRVPYGTRSDETIIKYSLDDLRFLESNGVKAVLIACGTVSAIALETLRTKTSLDIIGVVEPACRKAAELSKLPNVGGVCGRIGILGTPATVKKGAYETEIGKISSDLKMAAVGCPMFVPLVENGYIQPNNPITLSIAKEYIFKLADFRPNSIILGCTHYPIIKETVETACKEVLGYVPKLVDSGACAAEAVAAMLETSEKQACKDNKGCSNFFVSDEPHNFSDIASAFLGRSIDRVTRVDIEKYRNNCPKN